MGWGCVDCFTLCFLCLGLGWVCLFAFGWFGGIWILVGLVGLVWCSIWLFCGVLGFGFGFWFYTLGVLRGVGVFWVGFGFGLGGVGWVWILFGFWVWVVSCGFAV